MLTHTLSIPDIANKISPVAYPAPAPDQFGAVTGHAGLIATEFSYQKDEEIYGEDEPAEYVYQVICGAVRSFKLLSDGRRQIGAFHLPGDVFGLEFGIDPPAGSGCHHRYHRATGEAAQPRAGSRGRCPGCAQALGDDGRRPSACRRPHAASRAQDCDGARSDLPPGNGSSTCRYGNDGTANVPQGYWRLSGPHAGNGLKSSFAAPCAGGSRVLRRSSDRASQPPALAQHGCMRMVRRGYVPRVTFT